MQIRFPGWPGSSGRQAAPSRPSVASAAVAARLAHAGVVSGLGSASVGAQRHLAAVERAAVSGPLLVKATRRAQRGLTPDLLWATARAAQRSSRQPEEIWAEALRDWLASQPPSPALVPAHSRPMDLRRQQKWSAIDETLQVLRAS